MCKNEEPVTKKRNVVQEKGRQRNGKHEEKQKNLEEKYKAIREILVYEQVVKNKAMGHEKMSKKSSEGI